jgi:nicotinate-nucleotide adenylyltransferase
MKYRRAVGLLGGSFNPAHEGHREISLLALKRLGLSEVWWLVSPGNPLKERSELTPFEARCAQAKKIADHPRIRISTFERDVGLVYTHDTLNALIASRPDLGFVWLMGADNLAGFHHWQRWAEIFSLLPVAVIDRPGYRYAAIASPAAQRFAQNRLEESDAAILAEARPPAWVYLGGILNPASSTRLRALTPSGTGSGKTG